MTTLAAPSSAVADRRAPLAIRFRGRADALTAADERALYDRAVSGAALDIREQTTAIIDRVRRDGDRALLEMAREYDGATLDALQVPRDSLVRALDELEPALRRSLERAASNIARVHRTWLPRTTETSPEPGIVIGRRPDPLERVGVYAPGGRAAYPSSVLMGAIPARVAGVREVILCSPPRSDGLPAPIVLAAAAIAGVDRVFAVGGAGAIAAMALGTAAIPRVDRVVGPGNAYVAEAKLQLTGVTAIDVPAGPSELIVLADRTSDPAVVARELVAQAEHDPAACVVALVIGDETADAIQRALEEHAEATPRRPIVQQALANQGALLTVDTVAEATAFVNRYAPEHLLIALPSIDRCTDILARVRHVGTVFLGETSSNAFGDYATGANHVLPTGGLARSYSGLSTLDFIRFTTYQRIDRAAAARLAPDVGSLAEGEGLPGHARAGRAWADSTLAEARPTSPRVGRLPRAEVAELSLYSEVRTECERTPALDVVDLSDNTNLWGTPPAALASLRDASARVSRYPSPYSGELKRALAAYVHASPESVVVGCGSDDVLDSAMRAFAAPGDSIAYSTPTFSMIPVLARLNGLLPIEIPLRDADDGYDIDADQLVDARAKIIYLCAPNNPTATPISREALVHVVENAAGVVILDEAYAEFAGISHIDLATRHEHVLVTRTLSKAFGLAGLRVGYGIGAPGLVTFVERARGPYKVSAPAERAALAALDMGPNALGWVEAHAELARDTRERFRSELMTLGLDPLPSSANFVLVPHAAAEALGERLRRDGVLVRVVTELPGSIRALAAANGNALRIGIAPWPLMQRTIELLGRALS